MKKSIAEKKIFSEVEKYYKQNPKILEALKTFNISKKKYLSAVSSLEDKKTITLTKSTVV